MKILLVHQPYRQVGGEERVVATQAKVLRARGHDVVMGDASQVARVQPDIVHVHNQFPSLSGATYRAAAAAHVPVVQHLHNTRLACIQPFLLRDGAACDDCVGRAPWPGVVHRCYRGSLLQSTAATVMQLRQRGAMRGVSRFVAVSEALASTLRASGAIASDRIAVCHNGLDEDPGARDPSRDEGYALFVGRLSYEKGVDLLVDAAAQLAPMRVVVGGDGPERDALVRRASPNVEFRGALDRGAVFDAMARARVLVAPSRGQEPFGLGVIEAAAVGVPAIVTRVGGMPEIVRHDETGMVVDPFDAAALVAALRACDDATRWHALGAAARRDFATRFSPDAFADRLLAIYDDVLATYAP